MLRRRLRRFLRAPSNAFLLALCIALAIALISVSLSSYPFDQRPNINVEEASEYWTVFGRRLKITDVLLVLATFALYWATRNLVLGAEKTAERQLRAYVFMEGSSTKLVQINVNGVLQTFIEGFVTLKNFGLSPASNYRNWIMIDVLPATTTPFDRTSTGLGRGIIGPSGGMNIPVFYGPVSAADIVAIRAATRRIYVWGEVLYTDAFGEDRYFRFYLRNAMEIPGKGWPLENADRPHEAN